MTEELKQAISALQCAKRGHCDHAMADEAIAALEALTQRPAAQAEREAFESRVTLNSIIKQYRIKAEDAHWLRASLPTQPAAQTEREADEVFLPRRLAATQKLTQLGYRYDSAHGKWLPAPQQATPEPVDWKPIKTSKGGREAVRNFFRSTLKRHDFDDYITGALAADFACVLGGYLQAITTAATPEPVGEAVAWWYIEDGEEKFGHPNGYRPDDARPLVFGDTRPAPGVPEDVQRDAERLDWLTFNISGKALRDIGVMWGEHANARAAIDAAMLAAAQAKGDDK